MDNYQEGQELKPYAGGGNYGKCLKCGRNGLKIIETPKDEPNQPIGWNKVPTE